MRKIDSNYLTSEVQVSTSTNNERKFEFFYELLLDGVINRFVKKIIILKVIERVDILSKNQQLLAGYMTTFCLRINFKRD